MPALLDLSELAKRCGFVDFSVEVEKKPGSGKISRAASSTLKYKTESLRNITDVHVNVEI